jgi:hypothetical protein
MPSGDCFKVAAQLALDVDRDPDLDVSEVFVAHGLVTGQAGRVLGLRYWHAWVEAKTSAGWVVLDHSNDRQVQMKRAAYYRAARLDPARDVWRYTLMQARAQMLGTETWGPWAEGWQSIGDEHLIEGALDIYTDRAETQ